MRFVEISSGPSYSVFMLYPKVSGRLGLIQTSTENLGVPEAGDSEDQVGDFWQVRRIAVCVTFPLIGSTSKSIFLHDRRHICVEMLIASPRLYQQTKMVKEWQTSRITSLTVSV